VDQINPPSHNPLSYCRFPAAVKAIMHASSTSASRRRRQPMSLSIAAAFVASAALLFLAPLPSANAALLRGGNSAAQQSPQHESHQDLKLVTIDNGEDEVEEFMQEDEAESSTQEDRALANDGSVGIKLFETKLLAKKFPFQMKFRKNNEISSAVASYLAGYLQDNIEESVNMLGLTCVRSEQNSVYVLRCNGEATFRGKTPGFTDFNEIVREAFEGVQKHKFIGIMYPDFEMIHEKEEWDNEKLLRRRGGTIKRKKTGGKKKKKKKGQKKQGGKKQQMMKLQSSSGSPGGDNVFGYSSAGIQQYSGGGKQGGNIKVQVKGGN